MTTISVTAQLIARAAADAAARGPNSGPGCAIALALRAAGYRAAEVGPYSSHYAGADGPVWIYHSAAVQRLVFRLMHGDDIPPCLLAVHGGWLTAYHEPPVRASQGAPAGSTPGTRKRDTSRRRRTS